MATNGTDLIADERDRQIEELGYTPEHDAEHEDGDLAYAAAVLASPSPIFLIRQQERPVHEAHGQGGSIAWVEPWPPNWVRTPRTGDLEDRIRELTKAGALIAAEIDRLLESR